MNPISFKHSFQRAAVLLALFFGLSSVAFAQSTIKGKVIDSEGNPIGGVGIFQKGGNQGVLSDNDGYFVFYASENEVTLVFSMLGYEEKEIKSGATNNLVVVLADSLEYLEESIVIGYGTATKKDLTGAVGVVKANEFAGMSITSANNILQGKVAGVTVSASSGAPGKGSVTRIRGIGTINSSDSPLYIVDGLPQGGIDYLSPNEIETITVHKDASAVAIYGSRAANGVIIVTTKSGAKGDKIMVSYDGSYSIQNPWKRPHMLTAEEYITYRNMAADNAGTDRLPAFATEENIEKVLNFVEKNTGSRAGTDWWNEIMHKNAPMQNHSLSINGGSEKLSFSSTLSYTDQDGIMKGTNYQRLSWRNTLNAQINERVNFSANIGLYNESRLLADENNPVTGTIFLSMAADPITPVFRNNLVGVPDFLSNIYLGYEPMNKYSQYAGILFSNKRNPVAQIERMRQSTYGSLAIRGGANLEIKLLDVLKFNSRFGMELGRGYTDGFQPSYQLSPSDYATENTVIESNTRSDYMVWEQTLNYDQQIGKFKLGALIGTSAEETKVRTSTASIQGTPNNDPSMAILSAGTINQAVSGYPYSNALLSFFGRATLNYDDKYLLAVNLRSDGSSKFAPGYRWGTFPSISAAWRISEEAFMESTRSWLDEAKLRVSYGHIGNQNISGGSYQSTYGTNIWNRYQFGNASTVYISSGRLSVGNASLKWETSKQFDLGLDLGLLRGKLDITADYFNKKICDMLMKEPQPSTLGYPNDPYANVGTMLNEGWEFSIGWNDKLGDFSYGINANISTYQNTVLSLGNGDAIYGTAYLTDMVVTKTEVGMPVGYFYGYVTNGIFQNAAEVEGSAQREISVPGDIRFKDLNGDDVLDARDRTIIGNPWPDFVYGLTLNMAYKGFDFSMFLQGSQGNDVLNMKMYDLESGTGYLNAPAGFLERSWKGEGTSGTFHRISESQGLNQEVSDYFVEDGSYLRIKSLQLGYSLPSKLVRKVGLSQFRVYVSAQNLLTLTKYSGLDPEMGSSSPLTNGIDSGYYPQARVFSLGVNLKF